ncbi:acyltransferase [Prevotella communis]|uniref:acyltransferase family protein n=1 Tax=Prevotella communis TaxID=2913614 RepID=UPI001ED9EC12|nr:acyltransferase [Prevotella communis]UKK67564.1 acyltransferase [Prevotella communis]UKK70290.1 acyltransferase [Prevotella communis]
MNKERQSSFELLRIIAQFMIVFYHILYFAVYPASGLSFYKAIWFPLHIGVPIFVFISGYFGIRASVKGFVKLAGMVLILSIPYMVEQVINAFNGLGGAKSLVKLPFFLSYTPFWFIRTYIFLYLLSPVINKFLKDITLVNRIFLLGALLYMSVYIGMLGSDESLKDGKNVVTFMLFYTIGDTLRYYKTKWDGLNINKTLCAFLLFNALVVAVFSYMGFGRIADAIWLRVFFAYCSPVLLINAIVFYIIIGKLNFHSRIINKIGKSSLAMYMVHGTFLFSLINPAVMYLYNLNDNIFFVLLNVFIITLITVIACAIIYWMLTPIWNIIAIIGEKTQNNIEARLLSLQR